MRFRLSCTSFLLTLAILVLCSLTEARLRAEDESAKSPAKISEEAGGQTTSAARSSERKQSSLMDLEQKLFKPLKTFTPEGSLNGMSARPLPSPSTPSLIPNKRVRDLMERRKNWVFMSPEEITAGPTTAEMFKMPEYGPDGQEIKKLSPLEQFYKNLDRKQNNTLKKDSLGPPDALDSSLHGNSLSGPEEDANLSAGMNETERTLKKLFRGDPVAGVDLPSKRSSGFSDIFGLERSPKAGVKTDAQKARMEEFKQLLGSSAVSLKGTDSLNPLGSLMDPMQSTTSPATASKGLPEYNRRSGYDAQLGTISPILRPGALPEVAPRLSGPPSLTPELPKVEPRKVTPPNPNFNAPRRSF